MVILHLAACIPGLGFLRDECGDDTGEDLHAFSNGRCVEAEGGDGILLVFASSLASDGDLASYAGGNGLQGADAICADAAAAGELPGTYRAFVSTPAVDAIDRITADGPWYLVDPSNRRSLFPNRASLGTGIGAALDEDEYGKDLEYDEFLWTGSTQTGRRDGQAHCSSWTSDGNQDVGATFDQSFLDDGRADCARRGHLACFQVE